VTQRSTFWCDEQGVTSIEYALIAGLIAIAILGGLASLGGATQAMYDRISSSVLVAVGP